MIFKCLQHNLKTYQTSKYVDDKMSWIVQTFSKSLSKKSKRHFSLSLNSFEVILILKMRSHHTSYVHNKHTLQQIKFTVSSIKLCCCGRCHMCGNPGISIYWNSIVIRFHRGRGLAGPRHTQALLWSKQTSQSLIYPVCRRYQNIKTTNTFYMESVRKRIWFSVHWMTDPTHVRGVLTADTTPG